MVLLTALALFTSEAIAQTGEVTTEAPFVAKPAKTTAQKTTVQKTGAEKIAAPHKTKAATALKKTGGYDLGPEPTSKSIPMDFSYMKKPDDGRAHHETETASPSQSQGLAPTMGTTGNGGFSPGMSLGF
jgi:hypothetical protein